MKIGFSFKLETAFSPLKPLLHKANRILEALLTGR